MKKIFSVVSVLFVFSSAIFFGCKSEDNSDDNVTPVTSHAVDSSKYPIKDGYLRINTLASNATNAWIWGDFTAEAIATCTGWNNNNGAFPKTGKNGDFVYFDIPVASNPESVSFILRSNYGDGKVSGSNDVTYYFPTKYNEIFLEKNSGTIYVDSACSKTPEGLIGAMITSKTEIKLSSAGSPNYSSETVSVNVNDSKVNASISGSTVTLSSEITGTEKITVTYKDAKGTDKRTATFASAAIDTLFDASNEELGWNDGTGTLSLWAPTASKVTLRLYKNYNDANPEQIIDMTKGEKGIWKNTSLSVYKDYFYDFLITNQGKEKQVFDPYAKSMAVFDSNTSANGTHQYGLGVLVDSSKMGNVTNGYVSIEKYEDAIIYEISVRDFTVDPAIKSELGAATPGTYAAFENKVAYLKDLGVTHIQLMPIMNCFNGDESNQNYEDKGTAKDNNYNWGYDPHSYFTPEGWYATAPTDPYSRVTELKSLINTIHANGMGVILDCVYNHVADAAVLENIVPDYYFRKNGKSFTNQSGCGNDTATEHKMMAKLMQDSLLYWLKEYKVDGFRFDIMGLIDANAVKAAYAKCKEINPSVIFEGEGWLYGAVNGVTFMNQKLMDSTENIACFNDGLRDLSKGGGLSDSGKGFITGSNKSEKRYFANISGLPSKTAGDNFTVDDPGDIVQALVCHDGLTLHDAVCVGTKLSDENASQKAEIIKRIKLGNFISLTSQGIAFLHGGQERGRTKPKKNATTELAGDYVRNSYDASDNINQITWTLDPAYTELLEYTKGLIKLRKEVGAFHFGTKADIESNISLISNDDAHLMAYKITDSTNNCTWVLAINANTDDTTFDTGVTLTGASVLVDGTKAGTESITGSSVTFSEKKLTVPALTATVIKVGN